MKYSIIAKAYDIYGKKAITEWALGYSNVVKFLKPINNATVLDYGCGSGIFSRFIRDKGAKVVGVDISRNMIRTAKNYDFKNIEYYYIKNSNLDFIKSSSIDFAVLNFVLCTIPSKVEIIKILKEISRILKQKGKVIILNANWEAGNGKEFISFKLNKVKNLISGKKVNVILKSKKFLKVEDYFWSKKDYIFMLKQANFKIYKIQEPVAKDKKYKWIDERKYSPLLIIIGKKIL